MELQADRAAEDLFDAGPRAATVALAGEPEVHRQRIGRLQHQPDVSAPRRARRRVGAGRRPRAAADEGCHPAGERRRAICCGRDEMDVRVDAARREDEAFAGDGFGRDADDHARRDAGHHVGVAGLADGARCGRA